jgi:DNA-directed RNA polymerase specialized sigma24 family protein
MNKASSGNEFLNEYTRTLIRIKAKQLVRRPGFSRSDQPDVEQDLSLYLLSQASRFDPARGSLNTFVASVVNSAVAMLVRERGRVKRNPAGDVEVQSLEEKVEQADGPPAPLWAIVSIVDLERRTGGDSLSDIELFELLESVGAAIASLPPELQRVCRSLKKRNRTDTERELKMSRRNLDTAIDSIRQHLTRAGLAKS